MAQRQRIGDWEDEYKRKLVSAEDAVAHIKSGDRIWLSCGQSPPALLTALVARKDELWNVEVKAHHGARDYGWFSLEDQEHFYINTIHSGAATRGPLAERTIDYTPWWVWGVHKGLSDRRSGYEPFDATFLTVTPPNAQGYCCTGNTLWDAITSLKYAKLRIAEVNDHLPRTFGESWVHVSQIDWFVLNPRQETERPQPELDPWDEPIAKYVSTLIRDGDTIQIGTGSTTGHLVACGAFDTKNDLGYFAELTVPGTIDLVKKGIITSKYMTSHPGKFIVTTLGNSPNDLEYIDGNPFFELHPVDYVHDPRAVAMNDNMVAINNAITIDLTGQIGAGHIGPRIYTGTGGQFAYALGAFLSKGGRYICVLPSTARSGTVSRIVPQFEPGQIVTVPRDISDIVVTEYGIAELLNRSQRERAQALINIAHPNFRDELQSEAKRLFWPHRTSV